MAGDTIITVVGNLTDDPELRFTPCGAAVANFTVASTPRVLDKQTNEWKDGDTLFLRCSVWRQAAENVAESLQRGMRVIVTGRLRQRSYETKEGEKRTVVELEVDEVGPSLRYATAKVNKTQRGGGGGGGGSGGGGVRWPGGRGGGGGPWRRWRWRRWAAPVRRQTTSRLLAFGRLYATRLSVRTDAPITLSSLTIRPRGQEEHHDGQATRAQAEEEAESAQGRQDHGGRLQGHRPAAQVHLRPRQDPRSPGDRCQLQQQREIAKAVKNAREMALLPYTSSAR